VSSFRSRLLVFGYPLLEVATFYLVAQLIGWGWAFLLLILGFPIGFALMRNAGDAAMRDMVAAANAGTQVDASRHTLSFVGGLLILIPGFWTDLLGLLLVIPFTQHLFRKRTRSWFEQRFKTVRVPGAHYPSGDVIQGTVIKAEPTREGPAQPPELPGSV
jgi:UPF0716 protein FxsA